MRDERNPEKSKGATNADGHSLGNSATRRKASGCARRGASFLGFAALAECHDFRWIDGIVVDLHFNDSAAFVDHVVDAASCFVLGIVETILAGNIPSPVTQEWESDGDFFCPRGVAEGAVHAYTQDLGVCSFQLFQILLEVLHLFGSTTGEGENVKRQGHVFLATEVMQGHLVD